MGVDFTAPPLAASCAVISSSDIAAAYDTLFRQETIASKAKDAFNFLNIMFPYIFLP